MMLIKDDPERIVRIALIDQKLASNIEPPIDKTVFFGWALRRRYVSVSSTVETTRKCATAVIHY
jgi:hypothetical protein